MQDNISLFKSDDEFITVKGEDIGLNFDIRFDLIGFNRFNQDKNVILEAIGDANADNEKIELVAYFEMTDNNNILPFIFDVDKDTYDTKDVYCNNAVYNDVPDFAVFITVCIKFLNVIWPIVYLFYNHEIEAEEFVAFCKDFYQKFNQFREEQMRLNIQGFKLKYCNEEDKENTEEKEENVNV